MRKILLSISYSRQKLFDGEFDILRDWYTKIIDKYNLPIILLGYAGGYDDQYINHDIKTVCLKSNDKFIANKYYEFHKIILDNPWIAEEYDVVVTQNTSTVVNLVALNQMIQDPRFSIDVVYGELISSWVCNIYPQGRLFIYSKEIRDKVLDEWNNVITNQRLTDTSKNGDYDWQNADDYVFGICCNKLGIKYQDISRTFFGIYKNQNGRSISLDNLTNFNELSTTMVMQMKCLTQSSNDVFKIRESVEPILILLANAIYSRPYTIDELMEICDKAYA